MRRFLLIVLMTSSFVLAGPGILHADTHGEMKDGWLVLFDGTSLNGWAHTGGGYFILNPIDKCLQSVGGTGIIFYYDRPFRDFVLQLEWRGSVEDANSGVFIRFPNLPKIKFEGKKKVNGYWMAVNEGYEIQIYDPGPPEHRTGTVIPGGLCHKKASKAPGQWNRMEITVKGQHYAVKVNGVVINEFDGNRGREGYIGLQNHDRDTYTQFRNVRVKELK